MLGIQYPHFRGQRSWTVDQLRDAAESATTWEEVADRLGLAGPNNVGSLRGHAARLGLPVAHLENPEMASVGFGAVPAMHNLGRAGALFAATWFTLAGYEVSWPLEPCRYDLAVRRDDEFRRVQVKTTRTREGAGWKVYLSNARGVRRTYSPEEIDDFFIIDGELNAYLMPLAVVGGLQAINLSAYERFRVPTGFTGKDPDGMTGRIRHDES